MKAGSANNDLKRKTQFNILLIEDNATDVLVVRSHIKKLVDFKLQAVEDLSQAIDYLDRHAFDVILLDLNLPDALGLEGLTKLRRHVPKIPIVVLTGFDDEELGIMALQCGAQDYLIKGADNSRLVKSIRYAIERMLVNGLDDNGSQPNSDTTSVMDSVKKAQQSQILTERELQILRLVGKGYNNQEITERFGLSLPTVKTHISHILRKLSVSDRTKAIVEARHRGLI